MHWPIAFQPGDVKMPKNPDGTINYGDTPFIDTWAAMEKLVDEGLVKHIGLSNFNSKQIDEVSKIQYPPPPFSLPQFFGGDRKGSVGNYHENWQWLCHPLCSAKTTIASPVTSTHMA